MLLYILRKAELNRVDIIRFYVLSFFIFKILMEFVGVTLINKII